MSVVRISSQTAFHSGMSRDSWGHTVGNLLDGVERHASRIEAEVDWDSLEFETETDFVDDRTLAGPERELRITTLRAKALGVTK